jgi:hypothetical protein
MPPKRDDDRDADRDAKRVESRAESITADELEAGSDDPRAQADAILADSDARTEDRVAPAGEPVESGQSDDNVDPDQ